MSQYLMTSPQRPYPQQQSMPQFQPRPPMQQFPPQGRVPASPYRPGPPVTQAPPMSQAPINYPPQFRLPQAQGFPFQGPQQNIYQSSPVRQFPQQQIIPPQVPQQVQRQPPYQQAPPQFQQGPPIQQQRPPISNQQPVRVSQTQPVPQGIPQRQGQFPPQQYNQQVPFQQQQQPQQPSFVPPQFQQQPQYLNQQKFQPPQQQLQQQQQFPPQQKAQPQSQQKFTPPPQQQQQLPQQQKFVPPTQQQLQQQAPQQKQQWNPAPNQGNSKDDDLEKKFQEAIDRTRQLVDKYNNPQADQSKQNNVQPQNYDNYNHAGEQDIQEAQLQDLALQYEDGYIYRGQGYEPATREGFGVLTDQNENEVYSGWWRDNQYHGQGKLINFQAEQIDGPFDYRDLSNIDNGWLGYEGEFSEGKMHGKGMLQLTNGEKFEGQFNDGMIDGEGIYSTVDGQDIKGQWREGVQRYD